MPATQRKPKANCSFVLALPSRLLLGADHGNQLIKYLPGRSGKAAAEPTIAHPENIPVLVRKGPKRGDVG
jgi:hypothetical protein